MKACLAGLAVIGLLLWGVNGLHAQGLATINGTVEDASHAVVPRATVTLTEVNTGQARVATSSRDGYFTFTSLRPGTYTLKVSLAGFKTWEQQNIVLHVAQYASFQPILQVGNVSQSVQVTSAPALVTTSSSSVGTLVGSSEIKELPLNGRDALQLVALSPGVVSTGTISQFGVSEPSFAPSGGRDIDINYYLDGGTNANPFYATSINFPNPDALQEFRVSSRNYSAEYGRGSTTISAVTRPGTNHFHGDAFEFLRNNVLDARPFFSANRPVYKRNQFGGDLGGPIRKDKAFFFVSYQGTQVRGAPGSSSYNTLTAAERTGDFSALSKPIIDPTTGQPFQGNIIPPDRIEPQATNFINQWLPPANSGGDLFTYTPADRTSENEVVGKTDFSLSQNDHLTLRYLFDNVPQIAPQFGSSIGPEWLTSFPTRYQSATADWTHTFSPTLLNEANVTYVRSAFDALHLVHFSLADLGYPINTANEVHGFGLTSQSILSVNGYWGGLTNLGAPTRDIMPVWYFHDNLSWVKNIQSISLGAEYYHNRINELQNYLTGGNFSFTGQFTGNGGADFLLGDFNSYTQIEGFASRLQQTLPSFYVQDNIKLTRRLTLNAGLRWDPIEGYRSEDKELATFIAGKQSTLFPLAPVGLLYPGDAGLPGNIVGTRWDNLAPRLGLAWDVFGNGKTSVRAGGGIFYVPLSRGITLNRFPIMQPFVAQVVVNGGTAGDIWASPPFNGVNPFPRPSATNFAALAALPFVPDAAETAFPLPFKTEADNQWSLSVEQQLWRDAVLEVDYVGSSASHLTTSFELNPAVYIPGASTVANTQSRRLDPQIGPLMGIGNILTSNYNSLQVSFRQRYSHGLSINSYYTYSKALGIVGAETEGSEGPRDPFNHELDYGPLSYDLTHNWVTDFIWQPMHGRKFSNRLLGTLASGWGLTSIVTVHSGYPLSLVSGRDNSFTGIGSDTPDQIGPWQLPGGRSKGQQIQEWFNTKAFVPNAVGTFGTLGEDALRDPGYFDLDGAVLRDFVPREGYRLQFRTSFYNMFNHASLGAPVNNLTSPTFGRILSTASTPREIEFSLSLSF